MAEKKFAVDLNLMFNELKSARIENVATDPSVLYAGLFWFNTTNKSLNYSDGTAIYKIAIGGTLADAIAAALVEAKAYTDTAIITEISNRDTAISTAISAEDLKVGTDITNAIALEASARDSAISTAITGESSARDVAISNAISAEDTKITSDISSAISGEATSRDNAISMAISTEATNTDGKISTAINSEVIARNDAITQAVNTEALTRSENDAANLILAKKYADDLVTGLAGSFAGDFDASTGILPIATGVKAGSYWRVSVAGTIAGLTPVSNLEVGDIVVSKITSATLVTDFFALQGNLTGAVTNSDSVVVNEDLAVFDGTSGKVIKSTGFHVSDLASLGKIFDAEFAITSGVPVKVYIYGSVSQASYKSQIQIFDTSDESEVIVGITRASDGFIISSNISFTAHAVITTPKGVNRISTEPS